jgi:hypothetical protein
MFVYCILYESLVVVRPLLVQPPLKWEAMVAPYSAALLCSVDDPIGASDLSSCKMGHFSWCRCDSFEFANISLIKKQKQNIHIYIYQHF